MYVVSLQDNTNLTDIEEWLQKEVGDSHEPIDIELIFNENNEPEAYVVVHLWTWLSSDNLNNVFPSIKIGFAYEEDAIRFKLIWG